MDFQKGVPNYGLWHAENTWSAIDFFDGDEELENVAGNERVMDEICGD